MEPYIVTIVFSLASLWCLVSANNYSLKVRHVDWANGRNVFACLSDAQPQLPCKTLDYACKNLSGNTSINVSPGIQSLGTRVTLSYLHNISIVGVDLYKASIINCTVPNIGIRILNVKNIRIENLEFRLCGMLQESTSVSSFNESMTVSFSSALYFLNSTNVNITDANITNSNGTGITLFDTGGNVIIAGVNFSNNAVQKDHVHNLPGGGGLYIELTSCTPGRVSNCAPNPFVKNNQYTIRNCTFLGNIQSNLPNSTTTFLSQHGPSWQRFGFGGGISIAVRGESYNNHFAIQDCEIRDNKALIGGGIALIIDQLSQHNGFKFARLKFLSNHAVYGGGGIEFGFFSVSGTKNTSIEFLQSNFIKNSAVYGGAVAFYSSLADYSSKSNDFVSFISCLWVYNEALVGAAIVLYPEDWVSVSSGYLLVPLFHDCEFTANTIDYFNQKTTRKARDSVDGAIIYSSTFSLNFSGKTIFRSNSGSSIRVSFGDINVLDNSTLEFTGNVARKGGAISLIGFAGLVAYKNSVVEFSDNSAIESGGAVFYDSTDYLDVLNSRRCFLRYKELIPVSKWDAKFIFRNNTSRRYGHAIYATYLEACARASITNASTKYNILDVFHWKSFTFMPSLGSEPHIITTDPVSLYLDHDHIKVAPGIITDLKFVVKDGLEQNLETVLYTACEEDCQYGNVSDSYSYVSDEEIMFEGMQNKSIIINAETLHRRLLDVRLEVNIGYCPPAYYFEGGTCHCSVSTHHELPGIVGCVEDTNQAKMLVGYWAGCTNDTDDGSVALATGQCPLGYCYYVYSADGLVLLPNNCSLSQSLCLPNNRKGLLCGECIEGFSVYYHSDRYKCGDCDYAAYGIPFYIISELLPCTILFILIIVFDVSFTSGSVTSFILFAQVLDFFDTTAFGIYNVSTSISYLVKVYKFIFGFFNLNFFKLDLLSFCLWENASVLDVLAFKYVTTLYALFLVAMLFVLMRYCRCDVLKKFRKNEYGGYTVTNGLIAFVIITYFQCAKVSFEILTRYRITMDDDNLSHRDVVFLSGATPFFSRKHLWYAIPAILVLSYATIVALVLILQPLYAVCNKWLSNKHNDGETILQAPLCWRRMILNTKPLLDSFQHSFKDDMRVFAGLLFLYRLVISASFAFAVTAISMYSLLELIILIMLMIHSLFQPYSKKVYNVIDTLMYTDLAIINGISLYNVVAKSRHTEYVLAAIQVILIYIPILSFFGFLVVKLFCCRRSILKLGAKDDIHFDPDTLPDRMFENETGSISSENKHQRMDTYGSLQQERALTY